ncbi:hypothetical protein ACHAXT_012945 [Thalassiosira profunda]
MLHSWIASLAPSPAKKESSDWFLEGSYRVMLNDDGCIDTVPAEETVMKRSTASWDMSKVIEYSSALRIQAVDTLENGIKRNNTRVNERQLVMQGDEVISAPSLVEKAASQHGITAEKYLLDMRREAWGGGPEIVALANSLNRQIVLFEVANADESNGEEGDAIYLKKTSRFGPASGINPLYILSTNQGFPNDYRGKRSNHFLAVFPSQPI